MIPGQNSMHKVKFLCLSVSYLLRASQPTNLENTFKSVKGHSISDTTIQSYLGMLQDAFLVEKAVRYDIKGKRYINTPSKYYFEDTGLRNARLNYRQIVFRGQTAPLHPEYSRFAIRVARLGHPVTSSTAHLSIDESPLALLWTSMYIMFSPVIVKDSVVRTFSEELVK